MSGYLKNPEAATPSQKRLNDLIVAKFGEGRGSISRCADAINCRQGNLSNMLSGRTNVPDKYIAALEMLPDFIDPVIESAGLSGGKIFRVIVSAETQSILADMLAMDLTITNPAHEYRDVELSNRVLSNMLEVLAKSAFAERFEGTKEQTLLRAWRETRKAKGASIGVDNLIPASMKAALLKPDCLSNDEVDPLS